MTDKTFDNIFAHWQQVVDLPPQNVGPFTSLFKIVSSRLKVMPWMIFFLCAVLFVFSLFIFFGPQIIFIVETLQRGF